MATSEGGFMPQYLYVCLDCHKEFTKALHIADLTTIRLQCPHCGSEKVEQQVAEFAAVTSKKS
jgi:putative FmdB family regulatory protein